MQAEENVMVPGMRSTVVLIGASAADCGALSAGWAQAGHAVLAAPTAEEGLDLVVSPGADLVIFWGQEPDREELLSHQAPDFSIEPNESVAAIQGFIAGRLRRVPLRYFRKKDGTILPVEISGSVFNVQGRTMLCGLFRDLSERQQLEHELLRISELEQHTNGVSLRVEDNGKGLPQQPPAQPGMGLRIMRHRANLIGASLEVGSAGRRGVAVTCTVRVPAEPG